MLEEEVEQRLRSSRQQFQYRLSENDLKRLTAVYGEQYVSNACADLDQYFDLLNSRIFTRPIPTQLAVFYLFGSGKQYRASISALSSAGEAMAGYCLEQ